MEHCASVSGDLKRRRACGKDPFPDHAGRIYPLEADGREGSGRGRRVRHVPDRHRDRRL